MSHIENTLKMLFKLKRGEVIKKKDLAEEFGVSEKQISRYKNSIENLFTIESIPGPNGGYKMLDSYFPFKELLTKEEIMLLKIHINSSQNSMNKKLEKALEKINYTILKDSDSVVTQIIPYSKVNIDEEYIMKIQEDFYEAILNKYEVIIDYLGSNGKESTRRIQPYKLFIYKGESYIVANCLKRNDIRYFKIIRIKKYIITTKKFETKLDIEKFIEEERINNIGIFSGEEYDLELEIIPPMANSIKERIWVDNQHIEELEEGKILFKAIMKGEPELTSWILSMKSYVKVIKPESLKVKIKEELEKMIKNL